jgi:hypothetical protein
MRNRIVVCSQVAVLDLNDAGVVMGIGVPCAGVAAVGDTISTPGCGSNLILDQLNGCLSVTVLSFVIQRLC